MSSITDPFDSVNFSDLPSLSEFTARDGAHLAYRHYPSTATTPGKGSVVLVHGSSATSSSMHPMAKALSAAGYPVYALDIRGHGGSGRKGQIAYIGQLEDDLADFILTLARLKCSPRQHLLSPQRLLPHQHRQKRVECSARIAARFSFPRRLISMSA